MQDYGDGGDVELRQKMMGAAGVNSWVEKNGQWRLLDRGGRSIIIYMGQQQVTSTSLWYKDNTEEGLLFLLLFFWPPFHAL